VVRLRSPRLPAEAARAILFGTVILAGGCEAVFGPPMLASSGESSDGEGFDPDQEDAFTTGAHGSESDGFESDSDAAEVGGGDESPAFDLGNDTGRGPPPDNGGACCSPGTGVGCSDDVVEACVCAIDPACCESGWDELCAKHVIDAGCGSCDRGVGTNDVPVDCCMPLEDPGCLDEVAADCVCEVDPFCCMVQWDQVCVDTGIASGCLACAEPLGPAATSCCSPQIEPGCDDPEIEECVCATDAFCCDSVWDDLCASEVESLGCGVCAPPDVPSPDCCTESTVPGCGDPSIESCVCEQDDYCCSTAWDAICVNEVEGLGCGSCTNVGSTGDDYGTSDGGERTTGADPTGTTSN
jgi:hypothetical protein